MSYIKIIERGRYLPTVIAFSSVNTPKGKFKPFKIYEKLNANLILVNSPKNDWYQGEIPGISRDSSECAQDIVKKAREVGNGNVVTFGTSMGAAGAILFAVLGGADACMAFGAEAILKKPGSRSSMHMPADFTPRWPNLIDLINSRDCCPIYHYASEHDYEDIIAANHFRQAYAVTQISVRGCDHPGLQGFDIDGTLNAVLERFAHCKKPALGFARQGALFSNWAAVNGYIEATEQGNLDDFIALNNKFPGRALFRYRLGVAFQHSRDLNNAISNWEAACSLCEYQFEAHGKLANAYRKQGLLRKSLVHAQSGARINSRDPYSHHNLGLSLEANGELELAMSTLKKAATMRPGNKAFQESLQKIKDKTCTL